MPNRAYGQYCGFARALEVVGERWTLMIVRDLLIGGKRFGDIQRGLPGIPSNILTARLKELEAEGLVRRRAADAPGGGVLYELTAAGSSLEEAVIALGRWGAARLGDPRPDEIVTEDSIASALLTTFRPEAAGRTRASYWLSMGDINVNARVANGAVKIGRGPLEDADLVIETGPALRTLLASEITPDAAIKKKLVRVRGDRALLHRFVEMFKI